MTPIKRRRDELDSTNTQPAKKPETAALGTSTAAVNRPESASSKWLVVVGVPAVAFIAVFLGDAALAVPTLCLHALLWDAPCGGCGLTRAFVAVGRGEFGAATQFNPLWPVVMALMGWVFVRAAARKSDVWPPNWMLGIVLAAFVALHAARQFGWLALPVQVASA